MFLSNFWDLNYSKKELKFKFKIELINSYTVQFD